MALISNANLTLLRADEHRSTIYGSTNSSETVWTGVLAASVARGETSLTFNTGAGSFSVIKPEQELWIGTTAGNNDVGIVRLRTFTGAVTGSMLVSAHNYILSAGYHLTIKFNFKVLPRYPYIGGTPFSPTFLKDQNQFTYSILQYSDQNLNLQPVIIAGGNRAGWTGLTVNPNLDQSYTLDGSTITNYTATALFITGAGVVSTINAGTGVGTITFNTAGSYWVEYTVTSDNGKTETSYRFYRIHDANDLPLKNFGVTSVSQDWEGGGCTATIDAFDDADLLTIPDESIFIIWSDDAYGSTDGNIGLTDTNTLISGYLRQENVGVNLDQGTSRVNFTVATIENLMTNHFMFSMSLEAVNGTPSEWYEFRSDLTVLKGVHHFLRWHTTVLQIADVVGLNTDSALLRPYVELEAGNFYSLIDDLMRNSGIRYHAVTDFEGVLHCIPDVQLLTDAERGVLVNAWDIDFADESETETILRKPPNSTAWVKGSGFSWDGTFATGVLKSGLTCDYDICPDVEAHCSAAPAGLPDDDGPTITNFDRQTVLSQNHLDQLVARKYGQLNNLYPEVRLNLSGNYFRSFTVAQPYYWNKTIQAVDTVRGFVLSGHQMYCRQVTANIDAATGTITTSVILEPEVFQDIGVPVSCAGLPAAEGEVDQNLPPQTPIPDVGDLVYSASSFHYFNGSDWVLTTTEDTNDMRVDPWDYLTVWRTGPAFVKRSTDGGLTWSNVTPTNPPNDAGDSPAPTSPALVYEHLDVSYANQGEFVVIANWLNTSVGSPTFGERRSWIVRTGDNGVSWDWIYIQGVSAPLSYDGNATWESGSSGTILSKSLVPMSDSCFAVLRGNSASDVSAFLCSWSGASIVVEDILILDSGSTFQQARKINTTQLASTRHETGVGIQLDLLGVTSCSSVVVQDTLLLNSTALEFTALTRISDSEILVVSSTGASNIDAYVVDIVGTTLSLNTSFSVITSTSDTPSTVEMADSNTAVMFYGTSSSTNRLVSFTLSPQFVGTPVVVGDQSAGGGDPKMAILSSGVGIATYADNPGAIDSLRAFTLSGTTITMGASTTVVTTGGSFFSQGVIAPLTSDTFFYSINSTDQTTNSYRTYTVDTGTLVITDNGDEIKRFVSRLSTLASTWVLSSGVIGVILNTSNTTGQIFFFGIGSGGADAPPLGNSIKGLGIGLSKATGINTFITLRDYTDSKLYALTYDTDPLALTSGTVIYDGIILPQFAYPLTDWFDDARSWVYGRFQDPNNLAEGTNIIRTDDAGATWLNQVDSYLPDFVGSLYIAPDGYSFMVVNSNSTQTSKFYAGTTLAFKGSLPFNAHVNPHAMGVGLSREVYFGADIGQPYQISKSVYPYNSFSNFTFSHTTLDGVWSIEVPVQ